jgi:putative endonuclease
MKTPCVYFLTNKNNTVIYIGVTSNLIKRIYEHKTGKYKGFTLKYNCDKLVYYETFQSITEAILREKQLKAGNRKKKEDLINKNNSDWLDLSEDWLFNV